MICKLLLGVHSEDFSSFLANKSRLAFPTIEPSYGQLTGARIIFIKQLKRELVLR